MSGATPRARRASAELLGECRLTDSGGPETRISRVCPLPAGVERVEKLRDSTRRPMNLAIGARTCVIGGDGARPG
jgi:hypothetical protein